MAKKIRLEIEDPCHENWNNMNPVEKGRYCDSCQKQVIDFSNMSDREIAQFFKKPSTGSICGRFMTDQLNRDLDIPKKHIPWVKYFFTIAIPAFFASKAQAQMGKLKPKNDPVSMPEAVVISKSEPKNNKTANIIFPNCLGLKKVEPVMELAKTVKPTAATLLTPMVVMGMPAEIIDENAEEIIKGRVMNEDGSPVPYASIMLNGQKEGVMADEQGYFSIEPGKQWKHAELLVSSVGYAESRTIVLRKDKPQNLVITLAMKTAMPAVVMSARWGVIKRTDIMGGVSIVRTKTTPAVIAEPVVKKIQANVYPNPVLAGGTINIASKELKEGYYSFQLLSMKGQVVHQREVWVDDKATVLNFEVPRIAAGNYVLRMIHKSSGESFTEKVLIQ